MDIKDTFDKVDSFLETIDLFDFCSYVAIKKEKLPFVLEKLQNTKIKGKFYRAYEK